METRTRQPPSCVWRGRFHAVVGKGEGRPVRRRGGAFRDGDDGGPVRLARSVPRSEVLLALKLYPREFSGGKDRAPAWTQTRAAPSASRPDTRRSRVERAARARARAGVADQAFALVPRRAAEEGAADALHRPADRLAGAAPGDGRRGRPRAEAPRGRARKGSGRSSCWRLRKAGETRCMTDEDEYVPT